MMPCQSPLNFKMASVTIDHIWYSAGLWPKQKGLHCRILFSNTFAEKPLGISFGTNLFRANQAIRGRQTGTWHHFSEVAFLIHRAVYLSQVIFGLTTPLHFVLIEFSFGLCDSHPFV